MKITNFKIATKEGSKTTEAFLFVIEGVNFAAIKTKKLGFSISHFETGLNIRASLYDNYSDCIGDFQNYCAFANQDLIQTIKDKMGQYQILNDLEKVKEWKEPVKRIKPTLKITDNGEIFEVEYSTSFVHDSEKYVVSNQYVFEGKIKTSKLHTVYHFATGKTAQNGKSLNLTNTTALFIQRLNSFDSGMRNVYKNNLKSYLVINQ